MHAAAATTLPVASGKLPCLRDQASSSSSGPRLSAETTCKAAESRPPRDDRGPATSYSQTPVGSARSSQTFAVELCAGTAGLSAKLWGHGFATMPVDHARNRHLQGAPCVVLDLAQDSGWEVLYQMLGHDKKNTCMARRHAGRPARLERSRSLFS